MTARTPTIALLLFCLLGCVGCSSDDTTVFVQACLEFEGETEPGGVELRYNEELSGCTFLVIDVLVSNVSDVFGAQLAFTYPAEIMEFDELNLIGLSDSFLNQDGLLLLDFAQEGIAGEVKVVLTRDGSQTDQGLDAGDAALLVQLIFFQAAPSGQGDIVFDLGESALLAPGMPPQPILDVTFTGGNARIQ